MGVGLILTAADKVIIIEPNSNPRIELQGLLRAVRILQNKEVHITYLRYPAVQIENRLRKKSNLRKFFAKGILEGTNMREQKDKASSSENR